MTRQTELFLTDLAAILCCFLFGVMLVLGGTAWGKNRYISQHHININQGE